MAAPVLEIESRAYEKIGCVVKIEGGVYREDRGLGLS